VSRRFAIPTLALAAVAALLALPVPARAEGAKATTPAPACSSRSIDNTSPEMKAFLKGLRSVQAIGVPAVRETATSRVLVQEFAVTGSDGTPIKVSVTCAAAGCISGCATTGCNPTTIDGEPACTALVCKNSSGFPCPTQGTCSKSVTQSNSSTSSAD
jgi:hypothetical protein